MFNKNKPGQYDNDTAMGIPNPPTTPEPQRQTPEPRPHATPAPRSTNLSTLSSGVKYEGNISGAGDIQIDGTLKGDVRVARVVIGDGGVVEGAVAGDVVEVRGKVTGSITGKAVKLFSTARVEGDITQEQLMIEQGAWFQGRCLQAKREAAPAPEPKITPPADRYVPEKPVTPAMPGAKAEPKPA